MNFTFVRLLLDQYWRKETKIIFYSTLIGGILQILARRYIKNHPEFFEEKNKNLKKAEPEIQNKNRNRHLFPRGGALIELSGPMIAKAILAFLAENGLLVGLLGSTSVALGKIPTSTISTCLREALPQTLPELDRQKFILVDKGKIYLDQCDQNLEYLFRILKDTHVPFEEKEKLTRSILTKYLNLKTAEGRLNFVLCIVFILSLFFIQDISSYHILLKNLIEAIKEGRIPKGIGRAIIRQLKKRGLLVNPELLEVADF